MTRPGVEYVTSTVEKSVRRLLDKDEVLFRRGASEWTVAHRLGVYLEVFSDDYPEWVVDCEFNRQPFDESGSEYASNQTKKVRGETKRPDIIVHKRADPEIEFEGDNLLAIELKVNEERDGDINDIENIREAKEYDFGVFINLYENPTTLQDWDSSYLEWRPEQLNQ